MNIPELMGFEPVPIMQQEGPTSPLHETVTITDSVNGEKKDNKFLLYLLLAIPVYYIISN